MSAGARDASGSGGGPLRARSTPEGAMPSGATLAIVVNSG